MNKIWIAVGFLVCFSQAAGADQLCGTLKEVCLNRGCSRMITPSECPGSDNPCTDGAAVNVVATNSDAQTQLNHLTEGETSGVLVCASGRTENGEFMADSIVKQD